MEDRASGTEEASGIPAGYDQLPWSVRRGRHFKGGDVEHRSRLGGESTARLLAEMGYELMPEP
jgi:hypothetical protein